MKMWCIYIIIEMDIIHKKKVCHFYTTLNTLIKKRFHALSIGGTPKYVNLFLILIDLRVP